MAGYRVTGPRTSLAAFPGVEAERAPERALPALPAPAPAVAVAACAATVEDDGVPADE